MVDKGLYYLPVRSRGFEVACKLPACLDHPAKHNAKKVQDMMDEGNDIGVANHFKQATRSAAILQANQGYHAPFHGMKMEKLCVHSMCAKTSWSVQPCEGERCLRGDMASTATVVMLLSPRRLRQLSLGKRPSLEFSFPHILHSLSHFSTQLTASN